jgi:hypothetical protein
MKPVSKDKILGHPSTWRGTPLKVKIYVYTTNAAGQWSLEQLTWADPKNLTPVYLLPTIDQCIAH